MSTIPDLNLIEFDEKTHRYRYRAFSVTKIVNRVLNISYPKNNEMVKKAAQKGTAFHKEVEQIINKVGQEELAGENVSSADPLVSQGLIGGRSEIYEGEEKHLPEEVIDDIYPGRSEMMLGAFIKSFLVCGTCDLISTTSEKIYIGEGKTTSVVTDQKILSGKMQTRLYALLYYLANDDQRLMPVVITIGSPNKIIRFTHNSMHDLFRPSEGKAIVKTIRTIAEGYGN